MRAEKRARIAASAAATDAAPNCNAANSLVATTASTASVVPGAAVDGCVMDVGGMDMVSDGDGDDD